VLRSLVAVPLGIGDQVLGVLSLYGDHPDAFDDEAVELIEAFGAQAATAIHNANLYRESQQGRAAAEHEQQRLRELEQMKDEFLSTAAHELRTPLTTIRMSAGLAYEQLQLLDGIDTRLVDLMGLVVEGSARMQALVNDLLDLTRLEQGRTTLVLEALDLRSVTSAAVEMTRPLFESARQEISIRLPETYCGIRGDNARLEQVLINLLSNAHKYSPPGTRVEVRVARTGDECRVAVRDNGPGVPEAERERIFERFYRSSAHRQDRTASTGLGLPIARTIAELHGGRVWADAAPGGGSAFTLALPLLQ
jgi:signal transduction histidine kinase